MHPRSWDVCVARVLRTAVAWFSLAQAAEDVVLGALALWLIGGAQHSSAISLVSCSPGCSMPSVPLKAPRRCVQRGLAAAQLVEAPLARLRCASAGEHARGQLERFGGQRGDSGGRGKAGTGTRRRRHGKQD